MTKSKTAAVVDDKFIGETVLYTFSEDEFGDHGSATTGQTKTVPAVVVCVFGDNLVNLKIVTDGPGGFLWKTSVPRAVGPGEPDSWAPRDTA